MFHKILENYYAILVLILLLVFSASDSGWFQHTGVSATSSDPEVKFVPWGKECKIPSPDGFILPHEECDQSKGIFCQKYQQGLFCGCKIGASQSYDVGTGECRKMPNHNCAYVDQTANPGLLDKYPYHIKCHSTADCVLVSKNKDKKRDSPEADVGVCRCKPSYVLSRDKLQCVSATGGVSTSTPFSIVSLFGGVIGLMFTHRIALGT